MRRFPGVPNLCDAKWHAALQQSFTLVLVVPLICGINSIMSSHLPFSRRQCAAPSINLSLNLPLCLSSSCETAALWLSHHTSISLSPPSPCPSPHNPSSHSALTQFFPVLPLLLPPLLPLWPSVTHLSHSFILHLSILLSVTSLSPTVWPIYSSVLLLKHSSAVIIQIFKHLRGQLGKLFL